ncbi:MAG: CbiX/SirB N-terminal domain-containing protein [Opitutus sp.]
MSKRVLLVDNGSLEPQSTLQLRLLAAELDRRLDCRVDPVSLAHSAKIPIESLEGRRAELFEAALDRGWREGVREFVILPLFVGPSHAVVRHMPGLLAEGSKRSSLYRWRIASPLFVSGEKRLAEILVDHVRTLLVGGERPRVAIVDHGSPNVEVTEVRNAVASQVREMLGDTAGAVEPCSMERREGSDYDFNNPLLATLLAKPDWRTGSVITALLFIAAGRHAGADGDVAQICRAARTGESPSVKITPVLGQHPLLLDILVDRALSI